MIDFFSAALQLSMSSQDLRLDQAAMQYLWATNFTSHYYHKVRRLTRGLFPSGKVARIQNMNQQYQVRPMVVHINWIIGQVEKKKWLQQNNLWYIGSMFAEER